MKVIELLLKIALFPIWLLFIRIPKYIQYLMFYLNKEKIKVTRKNCVFIMNPLSGKQIGQEVMDILHEVHDSKYIINLLDGNYLEKLQQFLKELPKGEKLNVIIGGGDGSVSSLIQEFQEKIKDFNRLVFLPFPLGLGNDLSIYLNFGGNMDIYYMHKFFEQLNSPMTKEGEIDTWTITFKLQDKSYEKLMLLYFGLGCQAQTAKRYDSLRKIFPFLFQINKINRLFYAGSHISLWIPELFKGDKQTKFNNIKAYLDDKEIQINNISDMVIMNTFSRCGGVAGEWNKNLQLKKNKNKNWKPYDINDQKFEILSLDNYSHLAFVTIWFSIIDNFAQGSKIKWVIGDRPFTFHIDGEPETLNGPAEIEIKYRGKISFLKFNQ